jgi:hypothetical protein
MSKTLGFQCRAGLTRLAEAAGQNERTLHALLAAKPDHFGDGRCRGADQREIDVEGYGRQVRITPQGKDFRFLGIDRNDSPCELGIEQHLDRAVATL